MYTMRNALAAAAAALSLAACGPQPGSENPESAQNPTGSIIEDAREYAGRGTVGELDPLFDAAGREFNVPADLLKAISFTETRWQMVRGRGGVRGHAGGVRRDGASWRGAGARRGPGGRHRGAGEEGRAVQHPRGRGAAVGAR